MVSEISFPVELAFEESVDVALSTIAASE